MKRIKLFLTTCVVLLLGMAQVYAQNDYFIEVENMPEFPGGEGAFLEFISSNIKYPEEAKQKGVQGKVYVSFVVSKDGTVKDAKIVRGVDPMLDKEALRVINMSPKWQPGKDKRENVDVQYTAPIVFKLDDEEEKSSESTEGDKPIFYVVEEMPEFPGGQDGVRNFVSKNLKYPKDAVENNITGKVYVSFIISDTGKVKYAKIIHGIDPMLDKEALRVVNLLPDWKPGKQRGQNVNVQYTIPISFALN